jgi:hypothetical protein
MRLTMRPRIYEYLTLTLHVQFQIRDIPVKLGIKLNENPQPGRRPGIQCPAIGQSAWTAAAPWDTTISRVEAVRAHVPGDGWNSSPDGGPPPFGMQNVSFLVRDRKNANLGAQLLVTLDLAH